MRVDHHKKCIEPFSLSILALPAARFELVPAALFFEILPKYSI